MCPSKSRSIFSIRQAEPRPGRSRRRVVMLAPNGGPPRTSCLGSRLANVAGSELAQRRRCGAHEAIDRGHRTRGGHDASWRADIAPRRRSQLFLSQRGPLGLGLRGFIYLDQSGQRLHGQHRRDQHRRGQRQSLDIRNHCANPHSGSRPGGCRRHRNSHHSKQAKSNRSSSIPGGCRTHHSRQARSNHSSHIHSLYPSKLRPGGSQGQEEALRLLRLRQLFVSACDGSLSDVPAVELMPVARPRYT